MRPSRLRRSLALLLATVAVVASACGSVDSPAASIGSSEISQDSLRGELADIEDNGPYRTALEEQYGPLTGAGKGTFSSGFVARVLSLRIYYELLARDLDRRGVEVTDADRAAAQAGVDEQLESFGEDADLFTTRQRERLVDQQALLAAVTRAIAGDPRAFYQANLGLFVQGCVSHILVGNESRTDADAKVLADELKRQLDAGADFATLARERSDDTGSGASGGDLGCASLSRYVEAFATAAAAAPLGQVTAPVQSEFGYHLIRVASRTQQTYEQASADVTSRMSQDQGGALDELLVAVTCDEDVDVDVDPQYGRWDRSQCESGGIAAVTPPAGSDDAGTG